MTEKLEKNVGLLVSTLTIIAILFSGFVWINSKFNSIEKDLVVIKTVLISKEFVKPEVFASKETK